MATLTISAKDLGYLAMPDFCRRCFWIKTHVKLPYQVFPGIFSSIDSYSKKVTNVHHAVHANIPAWLSEFGDFVEPMDISGYTKFMIHDDKLDVVLRGVPDEVFRLRNNSFFVVDYKTAHYTDNQDELMPIYEVQLNAYAYIGDRTIFNPISGLGLLYYEPQTDLAPAALSNIILDNGFHLIFHAKLHSVRLDPDAIVQPLMRKAKEIYDLPSLPDATEGCKDCIKLNALVALFKDS